MDTETLSLAAYCTLHFVAMVIGTIIRFLDPARLPKAARYFALVSILSATVTWVILIRAALHTNSHDEQFFYGIFCVFVLAVTLSAVYTARHPPGNRASNATGNPKIQKAVAILHAVEVGKLDAHECPECSKPTVSVRFTHPAEDEYRLWLVCGSCNFESRVQCSGRPAHFSESHVDKQRELYDAKLLCNLKFPRP